MSSVVIRSKVGILNRKVLQDFEIFVLPRTMANTRARSQLLARKSTSTCCGSFALAITHPRGPSRSGDLGQRAGRHEERPETVKYLLVEP